MKLPKAILHVFVGLLSGFCFQVSDSNYQRLFYNMLVARLSHLILLDFVTVKILKHKLWYRVLWNLSNATALPCSM
jgi:hypothetical protein